MEQQIQATKTCIECNAVCAKAGKRSDGLQRYRCSKCGKTSSDQKVQENIFGTKQAVNDTMAMLAIQLLVEGNSIRSTERITGVHRDTIMKLLTQAGTRCAEVMADKVRNITVSEVQADEIWGFVGKKESRRSFGEKDFHYLGDAWTFIAIDKDTKMVLAFELGKRNTESARKFMRKLAVATSEEQFQLTTDGFQPYLYAVGMELGDRVRFAQLVKNYANSVPEEKRRYSPARLTSAVKKEIYGDPDFDLICTSHIERQNGSLRQWCKRLTRLTYAFSKKWENLEAALNLHFAYSNFCRVHRTLKATPAMAAGITNHVWTLGELLN